MRNVTKETLSDAVVAAFGGGEDARLRLVLESLVRHLHGFVREMGLSHAEWRAGLEFLTAAGAITDEKRNEFALLSDVLGVSSLVDLVNSLPGATEGSVLGPFHEAGAPFVETGADLVRENDGDPVTLEGAITDTAGRPVAGAVIDFWQTAANGLYPQQDLEQRADNLRARIRAGADGRYSFRTIRPARYAVPYDGPVGDLLRATGRHAWRAAHFHMIVTAPGHVPVTTEVFDSEDPFIDEDAVFGVRESLIARFEPEGDGGATRVRFDVRLRGVGG